MAPADYPTYAGLGAQKAGTSRPHGWLAAHPQVCVPRDVKEVDFFTDHTSAASSGTAASFGPR